ncbi:Ankyrin repeat and KH domain-containing protein 1 [Lasiodiplodia hormozganensis]|uniref:Ankyrin repeat and KH domain-containing protein 1 n=1 Tax=Lasiodiplodia hormozganensis TaxID=869390 RepID=A0AA40CW08_9PEZI|nr:Ankyrin repeat and KH domain-containing protein 1 [Lasiodiplodia hormozganensis]
MEMVKLLLEHGAEVNAPPARDGGGTALQLAAIRGYIGIAWELMTKGANVDAKTSAVNGRTALEGASEHGRLDMVAVLLKAGAAENGKDHKQLKRAIEFARENGNFHICEFIEDVAGQALVEESELVDWDGQAAIMTET